MNEQERAAFYQAHKDDPTIWGDAKERDKPHRRKSLSATITVRFSAEEADLIRRMAEERSASYSDIIREAIKAYAEPSHPIIGGSLSQEYSGRSGITVRQPDIRPDATFRTELDVTTRSLARMG